MNKIPKKCPNCGAIDSVSLVRSLESVVVKGDAFNLEASYYLCDHCKTDFERMDEPDVLERAYFAYRAKHNMVQPERLIEWRKMLGLNQKELASLLGWSPATVSRYENGALQEDAHDNELQLAMEPEGLAVLLEKKVNSLPRELLDKLSEIANSALAAPSELGKLLVHKFKFENQNVVSFDKLNELILFFCGSSGQLKTKLNKLLFYADFKFFKNNGCSISGLDYLRYDYGPVPRNYDLIYEFLKESQLIDIEGVECGDYVGYNIVAKRQSNLSIFKEEELRVLLDVKETFLAVSASEISRRSHDEAAWRETSRKSVIPYAFSKQLSI